MERFEFSHRLGERHRLELGECSHMGRLAVADDQRRRGVVVHHPFDGVRNLVSERWLRILWQPAHKELDALDRVELIDAVLRDDIDHAGGETGVGDHADPLGFRRRIELLLFLHDVRVTAEISEMHTHVDGDGRETGVEVVRDGAHHRVAAGEHGTHGLGIADVERHRLEPGADERREECG